MNKAPAPRATVIKRIQRTVQSHVAHARESLQARRLDDEAVHTARKDLKRARSGLRLLRPLDEKAYQRENASLRNVGRRLSGLRDYKVLLEHLPDLLADERNNARRRLLLKLRGELRKVRKRLWGIMRAGGERERIDGALRMCAQQLRAWPALSDGQPDTAPALAVRRLYRQGRKAFRRSRSEPSDERLHEARKQAKRLEQALEILAPKSRPKKAQKVLSRAGHIGDWLGDDHDFSVVEERLLALPIADNKAKKKLRRHIDKRRARLQKKALAAARKLYRKKAKRVLGRVASGVSTPSS